MALPKTEGEFQVRTATTVGTFAGFAISLPVGNYFLTSVGDGGATRSLLGELKNQLDTATGRVWTLTLDDNSDTSTGKVTISCTGAATTATWSSTSIRNALGFTTNLASGTSWTGASQAKYLWLPNCGRSGIMSPQASGGAYEADYSLALGSDGTAYALSYSTRRKDSMEFRTVLGSKTWFRKEVTANESFEVYYGNVIALGLRTRFHADRSDDATYRTWVMETGNFEPQPVREDWADGAASLWTFRYGVRETT